MTPIGYILSVHRRLNLTRPRWEKLNAHFAGDWRAAYTAPIKDWQAAGVDPLGLKRFFSTPEKRSGAAELEILQECGAQVLTWESEDYPAAWRNIPQPPAVLFYRGKVENLNTKTLAVVGSRKVTEYGRRVLQSVLKPVFERGVTIVSGLAFGVDAAAHQLALEVNAPTVAVLGNGIDYFYPRSHDRLGQQILQAGGTIVSEYWPGQEARSENFPSRNRLVAGLAQATVVVEGAIKSGSLITGRLANEMGREVWAVPGDVFRTNSEGCNQLILQGEASPLMHPDQLLESLRLQKTARLEVLELSEEEQALVRVLQRQATWELEEFLSQFDQPASQLNSHLTLLELKGAVIKQGNQVYLA